MCKINDSIVLLTSSNKRNLGCIPNLSSQKQYTSLYSINSSTVDRIESIESYHAKNVDILEVSGEYINLITNTLDSTLQTNCGNQTLFRYNFQSQIKTSIADIDACDTIKSIILSANSDVISIAILSMMQEQKQVLIYNVPVNGNTPTNMRQQTISTYFASDLLQFSRNDENFLVVLNSYDTSAEAIAVTYTVPAAIFR